MMSQIGAKQVFSLESNMSVCNRFGPCCTSTVGNCNAKSATTISAEAKGTCNSYTTE